MCKLSISSSSSKHTYGKQCYLLTKNLSHMDPRGGGGVEGRKADGEGKIWCACKFFSLLLLLRRQNSFECRKINLKCKYKTFCLAQKMILFFPSLSFRGEQKMEEEEEEEENCLLLPLWLRLELFLWWIESSRSPKWKCQPILHLLQHARKLSGGVCSNEIPSPPNLFIEEWEENDATIHRLICLHFLLRYAHKVRRARTRRSQSRIASSLVRSFDEKLPISWPRESLFLLLFLLLENEAINSQREYFFCGRKGKRVTAE